MKFLIYIILGLPLLFTTCDQNQEVKEPQKTSTNLTEQLDESSEINQIDSTVQYFEQAIATTPLIKIPHIETTNFDDFIDSSDYKKFDINSLQLHKIYPNFYRNNYRAIAKYKVDLNPQKFHSIVITTIKGTHEMESVLVNYNLKGGIIDYKIVAYDEIAEGMSSTQSRISNKSLTINQIFWGNHKEIKQTKYEILEDGTIKEITVKNLNKAINNFSLIEQTLNQLQLKEIAIKTDLITSMKMPNNTEETIIVIPEIHDEAEHFFELNSHIVIVASETGKILQHFFESSKTNQWVSDAITLEEFIIDTMLYRVTDEKEAFGIRTEYIGTSNANPYLKETISLFIKSADTLKKILPNFSLLNYGGEWDSDCLGSFLEEKKELNMSQNKTNGFYDILVKKKSIETINFKDENNQCDAKETRTEENLVLIYHKNAYK